MERLGEKMVEKKKPKIKYKSTILKEKEEKKSVSNEKSSKVNKNLDKNSEHQEKHETQKSHKSEHKEKEHKVMTQSEHKSHKAGTNEELKNKASRKKKINIWAVIAFIELIILIFLLVYNPNSGLDIKKDIQQGKPLIDNADKKASVDFYVMSYCPFGNQAEEFIYDVYKKMKDEVSFNPKYVIYTNYGGGSDKYCIKDPSDGKTYCSMHGIQELHQDIREMCVAKYFGMDKWFEFAIAMNDKCNSANADSCWEDVAKDLNLDVDKIKECEEKEGLDLVKEQYALNQKYGVRGSPTIFVDEQPYTGSRTAVSMMRVLCNLDSLKDSENCKDLPKCAADSDCPTKEGMVAKCENPGTQDAKCVYSEDAKVDLIVLNDDECPICDVSGIMSVNKRYFPNLVVKDVEADSDEGKKLIKEYNIEHLPAYIFSDNITKTASWQNNPSLSRFFVKVDDKYLLSDRAVGSTWPADPDKRQEYFDLLKNYPQKNLEVLNYTSGKPRLDYFVMSFCPYGNPAEEAAEKIYSLLGDKVEIVPHYILSVNDDKVSSLHGTQEANQDIRELCALDLFGLRKFFDFVIATNNKCNSQNADTCWEGAAKDAGLTDSEIAQIKNCFDNRGLEIAKEQENLNSELYTLYNGNLVNPSASPTFLINGQTYSGSRDANSIKEQLCNLFNDSDKPSECSETIESSGQTTPQGNC